MRLAGTWKQYSKNAMPQLATIATKRGLPLSAERCPYQAKLMKTFATTNNPSEVTVWRIDSR